MATYANGLIPDSVLVALSTVGRMPAEAAASYERMRAAALRDGVNLRPTSSADAHRTRAQQERVFFERYVPHNTGTGDRRVYNGRSYWRRPGVASAAVPGTSNHGNEDPAALDLTGLGGFSGDGYRWLAKHGAEYGWENPDWARNPRAGATPEPWHWEYSRVRDRHRGSGGGAATLIPTPTLPAHIQEAIMAGPIRMKIGKSITLIDVSVGTDVGVPNSEYDQALQRIKIPLEAVTQREWDLIRDMCSRVRDQRNTEIAAKVGAR